MDAADPANLTRQLKLYHSETKTTDWWFTPGSYKMDSGLGSAFAVARYHGWNALACRRARVDFPKEQQALVAHMDFRVLMIIDDVRTNDREQSLLNLRQALSLEISL